MTKFRTRKLGAILAPLRSLYIFWLSRDRMGCHEINRERKEEKMIQKYRIT